MMINRGTKLKFSTIIYIFCISIALSNCEPAKLLKNTASTHEFIQTNFEHQNLAAPKADKLDNSESQIRIQQIDTVKSISDGLGQNDADPNELTSVHRVWTASSSGSLDELSPEMISKFNNALPFLAAYATRPRLVGGQPQSASAVGVQQGDRASIGSGEAKFGAGLQVASSSPHKSRASIVPKLASLNEVSFDVSSLSKSEHHHRRKTILKRRNDKSGPKKRAQSAVSKRNSNKLSNKSTKRISTRRNSRRRSKKVSHSKRRGDSLRLTQPSSRQSVASDQSKVNPIDGVKGGGNVAKREPFFSSIRPNESDKKTMNNVKPTTATKVDDSEDRDIGEPSDSGDSEDSDNEPEFEPKRVGDSDVDEDGDTVTVMPKFDGVDDDPVLVADDTDGEQDELPGRGDTEADKDTKTSTGDDRSESSEGQDEPSGSGLAGGGGIGATTGSGGTAGSSQDSDVDDKDEKPRDTSDSGRPTSGARKVNDVQPGVELADHDDDDANAKDADDSKSGERKSTETKSDAGAKGNSINTNTNTNNSVDNDSGDDGDGDDDLSNNSVGSKVGGGRDSSSSGKDDRQGSGHDIGENDSDDIDYPVDGGEARVGHEGPKTVKGNGNGPKNGKPDQDCHHDDGLYHDHSHHSHHDTIKWLEDAIPGEPGVDYPILAGANVSGSRFSCRDQKWPGFYADVSNRCQVSSTVGLLGSTIKLFHSRNLTHLDS